MPEGLTLIITFAIGIAALVKASDVFTESAERLGMALGFPTFIIGVTIISIGTSLPELISSLFALSENVPEVVIGNVVGSNIANIFLVVGTASIASKKGIDITYDLLTVDLPLFVGSAFLLSLEVWDGDFTKGEAFLLICAYSMYLIYIITNSPNTAQEEDVEDNSRDDNKEETVSNNVFLLKQLGLIAVSATFIYIGANFTIDAVIGLSKLFKIGEEIIAVSAVALGTSLPELIVTINAARKGKAELAVGNVLGSNIFNTFMVMGIPGLVGHLEIPRTIVTESVPTMIAGTILLFFVAQDKKLTIWEGYLFYIMYIWFIGETFNFL
ncbi:MAG: calcium/sodium antiporter [Cyanobacteria bacterium P01_F01_bin.150]